MDSVDLGAKGIVIRYLGKLEDNCEGEAYNGVDGYKDEQDVSRRMEEHRYLCLIIRTAVR